MSALVAAAGCSAGSADNGVSRAEAGLQVASVRVRVAGVASEEHCRIQGDPFPIGRQIRIARSGTVTGICTVEAWAGADPDPGFTNMAVNASAFDRRLGATATEMTNDLADSFVLADEHGAATAPAIAAPALSPDDAFTNSVNNPREYAHRAGTAQVVYTAPHPFEGATTSASNGGTFHQARNIHLADTARNAIWVAGFDGGSFTLVTFRKFHITSSEINPESFPLLGDFFADPMPYSVAFHGHAQATCPHVAVGGGIEPSFRTGVAEIIRDYLDTAGKTTMTVATAPPAGCTAAIWGTDPDNFVNQIAVDGRGLQLEQHSSVRADNAARDAVQNAVRSVYDCLIDDPDHEQDLLPTQTQFQLASGNTAYTGGKCPRWIGRLGVTSAGLKILNVHHGLMGCPGTNTRIHVDYYRERADGAWERIGGGSIKWVSSCGQVLESGYEEPSVFLPDDDGDAIPNEPEDQDGMATTPVNLRAVVKVVDGSGSALPAVFSVATSGD